MILRRSLIPFFSSVLLLGSLSAQAVGGYWTAEWEVAGYRAFRSCEDLNGDGVRDLLHTNPWRQEMMAVHGVTGGTLWSRPTPLWALDSVCVGDVTGDGIPDVVTGVGDPLAAALGTVELRSGDTGALHRSTWVPGTTNIGRQLEAAGDVDQDGIPDYLAMEDTRAFILSGADDSILRIHGSYQEVLATSIGDLDGDGIREYLLRDPTGAGLVELYSGASGAVLRSHSGPEAGYGHTAVGITDLDADGVPDYLIAAPVWSLPGRSRVTAHSGATGAAIWEHQPADPVMEAGRQMAVVDDLDQDGFPEIAISDNQLARHGNHRVGLIEILSGRTGEVAMHLYGKPYFWGMGGWLADHDDLNGDGVRELVIGWTRDREGHGDPQTSIFSFRPGLIADVHQVSASAGGAVNFEVDFGVDEGGKDYLIRVSGSGKGPIVAGGVAVPLTADALFWWHVQQGSLPYFPGDVGTLNWSGKATAVLQLAPGAAASLVGSNLSFAALSHDGGSKGRMASVAVTVAVLP